MTASEPEFYVNPVIGFRAFRKDKGFYLPLSFDNTFYEVGKTYTAKCAGGRHFRTGSRRTEVIEHGPVPKVECGCGFYAYSSPSPQLNYHLPCAVVLLSGRIIVHSHGFRAEKMEIVEVVNTNPDKIGFDPAASISLYQTANRAEIAQRRSIRDKLIEIANRVATERGAAIMAFCEHCDGEGKFNGLVCDWCEGTGVDPDAKNGFAPQTRIFVKATLDEGRYDSPGVEKVVEEPDANLITSKLSNGLHAPALDLDNMKVKLVPSRSNDGYHWHLLIDKPMPWRDYVELLEVLAKVGIIEQGYYRASKNRGYSALRYPHVES